MISASLRRERVFARGKVRGLQQHGPVRDLKGVWYHTPVNLSPTLSNLPAGGEMHILQR